MKKTLYEAPAVEQMNIRFEENILSNKAASSPEKMTTQESTIWGTWED